MKINISSESFFHPIIIKKDVMNVRFNLKTVDRKKTQFVISDKSADKRLYKLTRTGKCFEKRSNNILFY